MSMDKAENPRGPRRGEREDDYVSFCIKYMIDRGEYPNTKKGRSQASGHCYSLYRRGRNDIQMEKVTLCAEMSVAFTNENKSSLEVSKGVTMIIGNRTYNGRHFLVDELQKSLSKWENKPVVLNHNESIENVVGHIEDVTLTSDGKLRAGKFLIDNYDKSETARTYIKEQQRIGNIVNVSISAWYEPSWETINGKENTLVARNLRPAHLGLVVHGACKPEDGCGIGLMKASDNSNRNEAKHILLLEKVKELEKRR